jgi:hypothetical protein
MWNVFQNQAAFNQNRVRAAKRRRAVELTETEMEEAAELEWEEAELGTVWLTKAEAAADREAAETEAAEVEAAATKCRRTVARCQRLSHLCTPMLQRVLDFLTGSELAKMLSVCHAIHPAIQHWERIVSSKVTHIYMHTRHTNLGRQAST